MRTESDTDLSTGATIGNETCVNEQLYELGDEQYSPAEAYSLELSAARTFEDLDVEVDSTGKPESRALNTYIIDMEGEDLSNAVNILDADQSGVERILEVMETEGLNQEEREQVRILVEQNHDVMHLEGDALTATSMVQH